MLIRRIEVRNFKCLNEPLILGGFKEGINVIAGSNELGKSTLLEAIKAVIFQQYNSGAKEVKEFRPYGSQVRPEVALDLEFDSKNYSIRKAFCAKQTAEFRSPGGVFEGSEAEEKIRELFGLQNIGKTTGAKKGPDAGIWGLLWVDQGTAEDGLQTSAGGKEVWTHVLESNINSINAGQRGRVLLRNIEKELDKYYTPKDGDPKDLLKKAIEEAKAKHGALEEALQSFAQYESKLNRLQLVQDKLAVYEKEKTLQNAQAEVEKATADINSFELLKPSLKAASEAEKLANVQFDQAQKQKDDRNKLKTKREETSKRIADLESGLKDQSITLTELKEKLKTAEEKIAATKKCCMDLEKSCEQVEHRERIQALELEMESITGKISSLEGLEQKLAENTGEQQKLLVSDTLLTKLRALDKELQTAEMRCNAAATRIQLKPLSSQKAVIDGNEITQATELSITKATEIKLDGWGDISILPGGEETEKFAQEFSRLKKQMEKELATISVASLEEAEGLLRRRKELELLITSTKNEIANLGSSAALKDRLRTAEDQLKQHKTALGTDTQPPAADKTPESLKAELKTARADLSAAEQAYKTQSSKHDQLVIDFNTRQATLKQNRDALIELEQAISETSHLTDELLENQLKDATLKLAEARQNAQNTRNDLGKFKESELNERLAEAKRVRDMTDKQIKSLSNDQLTLSTELNMDGQSGLGEKIEQLKGELQLAEKKRDQLKKTADALKLLRDTLRTAETESKEQIFQPVLQILTPYLKQLFPAAQLNINQSTFEISDLQRNGLNEPYTSLSTGTREQISVLTRIAVAKLLKQQGQPSVIVLDDALVYSDDDRFARMKEILKEVSSELQILILTCRLRDYSDIAESNIIQFQRTAGAVNR